MATKKLVDPVAEAIDAYTTHRRRDALRSVKAGGAIATYRALPWYKRLWCWVVGLW